MEVVVGRIKAMLTEMLPGMRHARRGMLLQRLPILDGVLAKVIPPFLVVETDGLVVAVEVGELAEEKEKKKCIAILIR